MQAERLQNFTPNDFVKSTRSPLEEVNHWLQSVSRRNNCLSLLESDLGHQVRNLNIPTNQGSSQGFRLAKYEFGYANT